MSGRHILYRILDDEGVLLYVGATTNPGGRIREHHRHQPWWGESATITLQHFETWDELIAAEERAINTEGAKYNVIHSPHAVRSQKPRGPQGKGTVYRRADGMWVGAVTVGVVDGKRKRKTVSSKNRAEAQLKLADLIAQVREAESQATVLPSETL